MTLYDLLKKSPRPEYVRRQTWGTEWRLHVRKYGHTVITEWWVNGSWYAYEPGLSLTAKDLIADDWEEVKGDN